MKSTLKSIPADFLKKCKKERQPSFITPMLATLTTNYFSSSEWLYEHKFDGVRCIAVKKNGKVTLMSRNRNVINREYPELEKALLKQAADNFIIDGEIVALNKKGISDFELLQSRINLTALLAIKEKVREMPIYYHVFDCMYVDGYNICSLPLFVRKKVVKNLLRFNTIIKYSQHLAGNGLTLFKQACKNHWEGLIVKKADSSYVSKRSPNWLKFKCSTGQELVIGGYTQPQGSRTDFGALLVGYYQQGKLHFAGKVGSGYSHETLEMLGKKLRAVEIKKCPFSHYDGPMSNVHWVTPKLVAEFEFAQWTAGGKLRVPRYKGLRDDKSAKKVIREKPKKTAIKKKDA
jgi:bifunctional non-homologous end joining protein LigD